MHQTSPIQPTAEATELSARTAERAKNIFVVLSTAGSLLGLIVGIVANLMLQ
ncbi:MAG: hypothetical protein ABI907_02345 [Ramlibacter sp.]